jgi:hypothetical protein
MVSTVGGHIAGDKPTYGVISMRTGRFSDERTE